MRAVGVRVVVGPRNDADVGRSGAPPPPRSAGGVAARTRVKSPPFGLPRADWRRRAACRDLPDEPAGHADRRRGGVGADCRGSITSVFGPRSMTRFRNDSEEAPCLAPVGELAVGEGHVHVADAVGGWARNRGWRVRRGAAVAGESGLKLGAEIAPVGAGRRTHCSIAPRRPAGSVRR